MKILKMDNKNDLQEALRNKLKEYIKNSFQSEYMYLYHEFSLFIDDCISDDELDETIKYVLNERKK